MVQRKLETIAIQAGRSPDAQTGAVMPPIHLTTTFVRGNEADYVYSRTGNPNRAALEECLTELEGGVQAIAFGSGMAAVAGVFQSLGQGDHVILPDDTYFGVRELVSRQLARWGLTHTLVDMTDLAAVQAALQPNTRLVWIETPSNPMLKITDIAAVAEIAHAAGIRVGVDGTWATPVLQPALAQGADLVVHSTTKYLGGHSDLTGGIIVVKEEDEFYAEMRAVQHIGGGVPSGFDCWLLLRGIRTLPYRMRRALRQCQAGGRISGRSPPSAHCPLSRTGQPPRSRRGPAPDERLWRHALHSSNGRPGRGRRHRQPHQNLRQSHQPGRRGKSD